jgi:hypothetical protein
LRWSTPEWGIENIPNKNSFIKLGNPVIEYKAKNENGYIGVTKFWMKPLSEQALEKTSNIDVYNSTAVVNRESDSTVSINISQTPQPIPLRTVLEAALGQKLAPADTNMPVPCSNGRVIFDCRGSNSSNGVLAIWFPCNKENVFPFYLIALNSHGWEKEEASTNDYRVFVRRKSGIESIVFSCLGDVGDTSSVALFSYEGAGHPFENWESSHP